MSENSLNELIQHCKENLRTGRPPTAFLNDNQIRDLQTRYAHFCDSYDEKGFLVNSNVVVTSLHTPSPYLHLMASNHYRDEDQWGSFWDQHRGGFCCVDTVLAGRMSSHHDSNYVPTAPEPQDVREFFIYERGKAWPMFPVAGFKENEYTFVFELLDNEL